MKITCICDNMPSRSLFCLWCNLDLRGAANACTQHQIARFTINYRSSQRDMQASGNYFVCRVWNSDRLMAALLLRCMNCTCYEVYDHINLAGSMLSKYFLLAEVPAHAWNGLQRLEAGERPRLGNLWHVTKQFVHLPLAFYFI